MRKRYEWKISSVKYNKYDSKDATDPRAQYIRTISNTGEHSGTLGRSIPYVQVMLLMWYFKVNNPDELSGKTFESESTKDNIAFKQLLTMILLQLLGNKDNY